jgi:hypothetical protein
MSNKTVQIIELQKEIETLNREIEKSAMVYNSKLFRANIAVSGIKKVYTRKGEKIIETEDMFFETLSVTMEDPDAVHFFNMYLATCTAKRIHLYMELEQLQNLQK